MEFSEQVVLFITMDQFSFFSNENDNFHMKYLSLHSYLIYMQYQGQV